MRLPRDTPRARAAWAARRWRSGGRSSWVRCMCRNLHHRARRASLRAPGESDGRRAPRGSLEAAVGGQSSRDQPELVGREGRAEEIGVLVLLTEEIEDHVHALAKVGPIGGAGTDQ